MTTQFLYPSQTYRGFPPSRSGLHRQSVYALFRALLSQCDALSFQPGERNALKNIARNRFRANRHTRSPRQLKLSFYAGYRALDILDDAVAGHVASNDRLKDYLERVPQHLQQAPKVEVRPKNEDPPYITPLEHQFMNVFPREAVDGERKVPFFVRANGFPMVRWKKPQPKKLSRAIQQMVQAKLKLLDDASAVQNEYLPLSQHEDQWDRLLRDDCNLQESHEDATLWVDVAHDMLQRYQKVGSARQWRTMERARRMLAIVDMEQALADKENKDREVLKKT